jgi:hypothetical protein
MKDNRFRYFLDTKSHETMTAIPLSNLFVEEKQKCIVIQKTEFLLRDLLSRENPFAEITSLVVTNVSCGPLERGIVLQAVHSSSYICGVFVVAASVCVCVCVCVDQLGMVMVRLSVCLF